LVVVVVEEKGMRICHTHACVVAIVELALLGGKFVS